jgi:hypothetical protein
MTGLFIKGCKNRIKSRKKIEEIQGIDENDEIDEVGGGNVIL